MGWLNGHFIHADVEKRISVLLLLEVIEECYVYDDYFY